LSRVSVFLPITGCEIKLVDVTATRRFNQSDPPSKKARLSLAVRRVRETTTYPSLQR